MTESVRIEADSLGEVRLPAEALYGAQTQRAVENFRVSGLRPYRAFIWSMAAVKRAAATVNRELGLLDAERTQAIRQAADEVGRGTWDAEFVVDPFQAGAGTSHNMNVNEVIANRATLLLGGRLGEYRVHPNDHVNMGQSTNDVVPTAIRLGCLWRLDELMGQVTSLADALDERAAAFEHVVKSGRTHLQDAVPVTLGQEFGAYALAVRRDGARLVRAAEGMRRLGIGGTAVGSGLNAHPEYAVRMVAQLAEDCGLELRLSENLFESMQSLADLADFSAALRTLALTLIRIANDFRLLASGPTTGLDELHLPPVQPGSSIMPGKVNPVMAEMVDMAMFHVIGCDTTVAWAVQAGQLELNVMLPVVAHSLFEMMQVTIGALEGFTVRCVRGVEANRARAEGWLARNPIVATALNPLIGYRAAAELVKEALARDLTIQTVALERAAAGVLRRIGDEHKLVSTAEVEAALHDMARLTRGGIQGSPGGG
jgi:fumarate hydratase class II